MGDILHFYQHYISVNTRYHCYFSNFTDLIGQSWFVMCLTFPIVSVSLTTGCRIIEPSCIISFVNCLFMVFVHFYSGWTICLLLQFSFQNLDNGSQQWLYTWRLYIENSWLCRTVTYDNVNAVWGLQTLLGTFYINILTPEDQYIDRSNAFLQVKCKTIMVVCWKMEGRGLQGWWSC